MGLRSLLEREARKRLWSADGDLSAAAADLGVGFE